MALRGLAAAAAATAVVGAFVMRRWDMQAGRHVADLTRARASDEWRFEERVAELETDLDESRELRTKLEQRLRAKRSELAKLRNEHAALLRRYATAETERATALEGRRLLEIETTTPPALPPARSARDDETDAVAPRDAEAADEPLDEVDVDDDLDADETDADDDLDADDAADETDAVDVEEEPEAPAVFSPEGSKLFLRAQVALAKLDPDAAKAAEAAETFTPVDEEPEKEVSARTAAEAVGGDTEAAREDEAEGKPEAADEHTRAAAPLTAAERHDSPAETAAADEADADATGTDATGTEEAGADATAGEETAQGEAASEGGEAGDGEAPVPASPVAGPSVPASSGTGSELVRRPAGPVVRPSGHFTVPTAVAVVPATAPVRRPAAEGGFDFFGTKEAEPADGLADVHNEDLADVVGQEALALHKAEAEAEFKPAGEEARGVGQVIDLTAHDETEHINLRGLRSVVS